METPDSRPSPAAISLSVFSPSTLLLFFALAMGCSWGIMIPGLIWLPPDGAMIAIYLAAFGPMVAAMAVISFRGGREQLRAWLKTIFNPRISLRLYLAGAFILPFSIGLFQYLLYRIWGGSHDMGEAVPWYLYLVYLIPTVLISGGNEEPGWRGYALPGLLKYMSPMAATLILGLFHAIWHLPLMNHYNTSFGWYLFNLLPLTLILNWFYLISAKSIWPVMLLHAGTNVIGSFLPTPDQVFGGLDSFMVLRGVVYWAIGLTICLATRGELGLHPEGYRIGEGIHLPGSR